MTSGGKIGTRKAAGLFGAFWLLCGCTTAVASNLPEVEANRAVVALEEHGVSAEKERDPDAEGRFRVNVGQGDAATAASVLSVEALPSRDSPGVLQSIGSGSMVPSRLAEHARLLAGIAGELEQSLQAVDGVVSARVHLSAPEHSPLDDQPQTKPSAAVLLRHRGAALPLVVSDVQKLVAGAVPGLSPADVSVVATPATLAVHAPERELRRVGPITVTRASLPPLRLLAGGAVLLDLLLFSAVLVLWSKVRRGEDALAQARGESDAAAR